MRGRLWSSPETVAGWIPHVSFRKSARIVATLAWPSNVSHEANICHLLQWCTQPELSLLKHHSTWVCRIHPGDQVPPTNDYASGSTPLSNDF